MSLIDISPPAFDLDIALAYGTPDNVTGKRHISVAPRKCLARGDRLNQG